LSDQAYARLMATARAVRMVSCGLAVPNPGMYTVITPLFRDDTPARPHAPPPLPLVACEICASGMAAPARTHDVNLDLCAVCCTDLGVKWLRDEAPKR
jgi:hypothetical protein